MMKYSFRLLLLFLILQIVKTNANSATVIIPANSVWWVWSNTAASAHQCNLTLADTSSTLNNNCGSSDNNIAINDPYPGTSTPQFKIGFLSSSGQYYFIMAIQNFNTQPTEVNFNVLWDIECNASNNTSTSEPAPTNTKSSKSDGISKFGNITNIYILTIVITFIIELRKLIV
ncbi:hypothetical protein C2G38_916295 [Gigaspora rosea]|uniref:Uncharacterized protein n=1 Tax=Gigaspora rosea TaxID=44941 RepID=A0A397VMH4_9GLOM|nr:hypothetical protein C2G38_916295 [Gigaspora rosea]